VFARSSVNVVNSITGPNRTANHREQQTLKQVPHFFLPFSFELFFSKENLILFLLFFSFLYISLHQLELHSLIRVEQSEKEDRN